MRLGLRLVRGLANADGGMIPIARDEPYVSSEDLWRRAGIPVAALERLADGDAFGSLGVNRRDALWTIRGLAHEVMPLFATADERDRVIRSEAEEPAVDLTFRASLNE